MIRYTAIVQHYYHSRCEYIYPICEALRQSTCPPELIILWNNHLDMTPCQQDTVVNTIDCDFNSLMGRWAAVLLAETPYVLIQDDDLLLQKRTAERLVTFADKYRYHMIGHSGRDLAHHTEKPYSDGTGVYAQSHVQTMADMVLGRVMAFHQQAIISGLYRVCYGLYPGRSDDIVFTYGRGMVPPISGDDGIIDLDERGEGLSHEPHHFAERNGMAIRIMDYERSLARGSL